MVRQSRESLLSAQFDDNIEIYLQYNEQISNYIEQIIIHIFNEDEYHKLKPINILHINWKFYRCMLVD